MGVVNTAMDLIDASLLNSTFNRNDLSELVCLTHLVQCRIRSVRDSK